MQGDLDDELSLRRALEGIDLVGGACKFKFHLLVLLRHQRSLFMSVLAIAERGCRAIAPDANVAHAVAATRSEKG